MIKYLPLLLLLVSCNGVDINEVHRAAKRGASMNSEACYTVMSGDLAGRYCLRYVGK